MNNIDPNHENSHIVHPEQLALSMALDIDAVSFCGKVWKPTWGGAGLPVCAECEARSERALAAVQPLINQQTAFVLRDWALTALESLQEAEKLAAVEGEEKAEFWKGYIQCITDEIHHLAFESNELVAGADDVLGDRIQLRHPDGTPKTNDEILIEATEIKKKF